MSGMRWRSRQLMRRPAASAAGGGSAVDWASIKSVNAYGNITGGAVTPIDWAGGDLVSTTPDIYIDGTNSDRIRLNQLGLYFCHANMILQSQPTTFTGALLANTNMFTNANSNTGSGPGGVYWDLRPSAGHPEDIATTNGEQLHNAWQDSDLPYYLKMNVFFGATTNVQIFFLVIVRLSDPIPGLV